MVMGMQMVSSEKQVGKIGNRGKGPPTRCNHMGQKSDPSENENFARHRAVAKKILDILLPLTGMHSLFDITPGWSSPTRV